MATSSVVLRLEGIPWSANRRSQLHFQQVHAHDEQWKRAARLKALDLRNRDRLPLFDPARVTLRYLFPDRRRRDPDNYVAAAKGLIDGLIGVLIVDDDFAHLQLAVEGVYGSSDGPAVEVVIEAVEGGKGG